MTAPGFFELYSAARPALPAGAYTASSDQQLLAHTPHDGDVPVAVPASQFHLEIVAPRYVMPPEQILSTFPPATSQGDWRERLPQIVLKRRTLPWERNPAPGTDPATAPPWLALVVLADGEGRLSSDVDVTQCVTPGVQLDADADVPRGKYLEVSQSVVDAAFPCRDELDLLCHVRRVDLSDTELALGDDDGYLAVVLSNRLPQPATPKTGTADATPLGYTAYLINLEGQLDKLVPTEPDPILFFDATVATNLVVPELLQPAPAATLDQLAMRLGSAAVTPRVDAVAPHLATNPAPAVARTTGVARGLEQAAASWATGPSRPGATTSRDLDVAREYQSGLNLGVLVELAQTLRFPVLVSWDFTCTGDGGFERLMNGLDVGLLGTVDTSTPTSTPLQIAPTGHIALSHRTRQGDENTAWYRGPLVPQPTVRTTPVDGVLPLAETGDQLRKVTPDGREDLSLAALFEIGRLLTLNKPALVAALMAWRNDLFGAARAREIADALAASFSAGIGVSAAGRRDAIEALVRDQVVARLTPPAGAASPVTRARVPDDLAELAAGAVLAGLGADPQSVLGAGSAFGVDGLAAVPVPVGQASTEPVSQDQLALTLLNTRLNSRVAELVISALKVDASQPRAAGVAARGAPTDDGLDRLIEAAVARRARTGG